MNGLTTLNWGRTVAWIAAATFLFVLGIVGAAAVADIPDLVVAQQEGGSDDEDPGGGGGGGG